MSVDRNIINYIAMIVLNHKESIKIGGEMGSFKMPSWRNGEAKEVSKEYYYDLDGDQYAFDITLLFPYDEEESIRITLFSNSNGISFHYKADDPNFKALKETLLRIGE